jgi:hypothetical protein
MSRRAGCAFDSLTALTRRAWSPAASGFAPALGRPPHTSPRPIRCSSMSIGWLQRVAYGALPTTRRTSPDSLPRVTFIWTCPITSNTTTRRDSTRSRRGRSRPASASGCGTNLARYPCHPMLGTAIPTESVQEPTISALDSPDDCSDARWTRRPPAQPGAIAGG